MRQTSSAECMCSRFRKTQCDAFCLRCCNYTSHQVCIYNVFSYLRIYIAHRGYRQEKNWWTGRAFYSQLPWWASHLCDIENANFRLNLANPLMSLRSTPLRCSCCTFTFRIRSAGYISNISLGGFSCSSLYTSTTCTFYFSNSVKHHEIPAKALKWESCG